MTAGGTVEADDIKGRNECPVYLRITALDMYTPEQRAIILNGARVHQAGRNPGRGKDYKKIQCWIIVNGEKIYKDQIGYLEPIIGLRRNTLQKQRARARKEGKSETVSNGFTWGWMA